MVLTGDRINAQEAKQSGNSLKHLYFIGAFHCCATSEFIPLQPVYSITYILLFNTGDTLDAWACTSAPNNECVRVFIRLGLVTLCSSQVWWVKSVPWTSWYLKLLNVERKSLPTPNWSPLWLKRLLTQVSKACFYIFIKLNTLKSTQPNVFQWDVTHSSVQLQLMSWLWLRAIVWKSAYSTLPSLRWVEKSIWKLARRFVTLHI